MEQLSLIDNIPNSTEPDDERLKHALMQEIGDPEYIKVTSKNPRFRNLRI